MSVMYKCLKIFLCYSAQTNHEEGAVRAAVETINKSARTHLGMEFELFTWKDLPPRAANTSNGGKENEILKHAQDCDIFLLVLSRRIGSKESDQEKTNLEREVDEALKRLPSGDLIMLSYFRVLESSVNPNEQEAGVARLKKRLHDAGIFYHEYRKPAQFARRIVPDLYTTLLESQFDTPKHRALRSFFRFGVAEKSPTRRLLISYPAVDRAYMQISNRDDDLWVRRLVPNIVYEDHRALLKLEKALRLIRFSDFHRCTIANLPGDWRYMNRFWICVPRNPIALERLTHHPDVRFSFAVRQGAPVQIKWKRTKSRSIDVGSPLETYLRLQRRGPENAKEWNKTLRDVMAKDYAVLARFPISDERVEAREGKLMEYFLGGIRGLGTWGAAWFIDRRSSELAGAEDWSSKQHLLEVTYLNGQVTLVEDVSAKPQGYFKQQLDPSFIEAQIREHRPEWA